MNGSVTVTVLPGLAKVFENRDVENKNFGSILQEDMGIDSDEVSNYSVRVDGETFNLDEVYEDKADSIIFTANAKGNS